MFVYVLQSEVNQNQYVGMSDNPERRLSDHNRGKVKTTRTAKPWKIIYQEKCKDRLEARVREKYLKSAAGRKFRKKLSVGL